LASAILNTQNTINPERLSICNWADSKESSLDKALAQAARRRGLKRKIMSTSK